MIRRVLCDCHFYYTMFCNQSQQHVTHSFIATLFVHEGLIFCCCLWEKSNNDNIYKMGKFVLFYDMTSFMRLSFLLHDVLQSKSTTRDSFFYCNMRTRCLRTKVLSFEGVRWKNLTMIIYIKSGSF